MSFFFTMITGKRRRVVIKDQNMRHLNFDDFQYLCEDTYLIPLDRLNNIRLEKTGYVATSILPKNLKQTVLCVSQPEAPIVPKHVEPVTEITIDKVCFELQIPEVKRKERKVVSSVEISRDKITELRGSLTPLFHELDPAYGDQLYRKDKQDWITKFGNEDLKMAQACGCDCNCGYILQRAAIEFPGFDVRSEYEAIQVDTPDFHIMKFIMHEALTVEQLNVIKRFRSKVTIYDNEENPEDLMVVIKNYLFHCDLTVSLTKLVSSICEEAEEEAS